MLLDFNEERILPLVTTRADLKRRTESKMELKMSQVPRRRKAISSVALWTTIAKGIGPKSEKVITGKERLSKFAATKKTGTIKLNRDLPGVGKALIPMTLESVHRKSTVAALYDAIEDKYRDKGYAVTVTRHARGRKPGQISRAEIWNRLCLVLDPGSTEQIFPNTPLPTGGTKSALADDINHYPPFEADGVFLVPGDLRMATTVGHAAAAIAGWYRSNNWKVT
jgi:hypothetical protein